MEQPRSINRHTDSDELFSEDENAPLTESTQGGGSLFSRITRSELISASVANITGFSLGLALGYSSPALLDLKEPKPHGLNLSNQQQSWFAALLALGGLFGAFTAALMMGKIGRKITIMITAIPFTFGWFFILFAREYKFLFFGRLLTGVGCGMGSTCVPIYIAETSSKHVRGFLGSMFQLSLTVGILAVYAGGLVLHYRWLAMACAGCSFCIMAIIPLPDSPVYLFRQHLTEEAVHALSWLRGPYADISLEQHEIQNSLLSQASSVHLGELFVHRTYRKPLLISVFLMIFQQFSGVNAVLSYAGNIFEGAGFQNSNMAVIILGAVQCVVTLIAALVIDRFGRKVLLLTSSVIQTITCITFAVFYILKSHHVASETTPYMQALSLGSVCLFITGFSIGWGAIPWLLMSEIFRMKARGISGGIATFFNWTCAFLVVKLFVDFENLIGDYDTFFAFAGANGLGLLFVIFVVPETKGKSLEEIELLM